ncbi:MAG: hypothetical protein D6754_04150 [Alphaproteobacteria bacterium]|nr:MAG: hypothetical protein D6754_04150 [Alphaproteobacteria bacterium]
MARITGLNAAQPGTAPGRRVFLPAILAGLALLAAGLVLTPERALALFRPGAGPGDEALMTGFRLLRAMLAAGGVWAIVLGLLPRPAAPAAALPAPPGWSRAEIALFAALMILAAALRLYGLDRGIWIDEMLTHVNYMPLTVGEIVTSYADANNHILFSVLARLSLEELGDTLWAFRLPAALFGLGSIAALHLLARRVTGRMEALFATALVTLSFHHIWFSQNARGYTALLFFTLISSVFLFDALRSGRRGPWLLYALTAALGAWTHLTIAFALIGQFAVWAVYAANGRQGAGLARWQGLFWGFVPLGLAILILHAPVLPQMLGGALLGTGLKGAGSEWVNPVWAALELIKGLGAGFGGLGMAVAGAGALVVAAGSISYARTRWEVAVLFYLPCLSALMLMLAIGYTIFPRFFFFAMGFAVLIVMRGATVLAGLAGRLLRASQANRTRLAALACAAILAASTASLRHVHAPKQDFEAAIAFIEENRRPGDVVLTLGIADFVFNRYYRKGWASVADAAGLDAARKDAARVWLVYTLPGLMQGAFPDIMARIGQDFRVAASFRGTLNGGEIVIARSP